MRLATENEDAVRLGSTLRSTARLASLRRIAAFAIGLTATRCANIATMPQPSQPCASPSVPGVRDPSRSGTTLGPVAAAVQPVASAPRSSSTPDIGRVDQGVPVDAGPMYEPGSPAACLTGGNVIVLAGEPADFIHPGYSVIREALFRVSPSDQQNMIDINVQPTSQELGSWWTFQFSTRDTGAPIRMQKYTQAENWTRAARERRPGLSIGGNSRGCNQSVGEFRIHDVLWLGPHLARLTVTFVQQCDGLSGVLRGCLHYENQLLLSATSATAVQTKGPN